jgi:hypothetical protein
MNSLVSCCIPEDQKPMNQYIETKENFFFQWTILEKKEYFFQLIRFWSFFFFLFFFCAKLFFLTSFWFSCICCELFATLVFFRWIEINNYLRQTRVVYEEASWFDTQIWEKPFFLIKTDKLISLQKVRPILRRMFTNLVSFFFFIIIFSLFLVFF